MLVSFSKHILCQEKLLAVHPYTPFEVASYRVARLSANLYDILANGFEYIYFEIEK